MEMQLTQKQQFVLAPQTIQSIEMLQMNSLQLVDYIETLAQENPIIELEETAITKSNDEIIEQYQWLYRSRPKAYDCKCIQDKEENTNVFDPSQQDSLLTEHLKEQVSNYFFSGEQEAIFHIFLRHLSEKGYLEEDICQIIQEIGYETQEIHTTLQLLQSLDPAGVAGRGVKECLTLQLKRIPTSPNCKLAVTIIEDYFEEIAKCHYGRIAKGLNVKQTQVSEAITLIKTLNPYPCSSFTKEEKVIYVVPDLYITQEEGKWCIQSNDSYLPSLHLSTYYCNLLESTNDTQVKEYIANKLSQAQHIVKGIHQRKNTILRCTEQICQLQEEFFKKGLDYIKPMTLAQIANPLDLHESTISRALQDKYFQCPKGVYSFQQLFTTSIKRKEGKEDCSSQTVKKLLEKMIAEENKVKPLSDQKICTLLQEQGIEISRRAIAKYRLDLHIPNTTGRRELAV